MENDDDLLAILKTDTINKSAKIKYKYPKD